MAIPKFVPNLDAYPRLGNEHLFAKYGSAIKKNVEHKLAPHRLKLDKLTEELEALSAKRDISVESIFEALDNQEKSLTRGVMTLGDSPVAAAGSPPRSHLMNARQELEKKQKEADELEEDFNKMLALAGRIRGLSNAIESYGVITRNFVDGDVYKLTLNELIYLGF